MAKRESVNEQEATKALSGKNQEHDEGIVSRAGLGLVKELTMALLEELRAIEALETPEFHDRIDFNEEVRRFEIELIRAALIRTGGHQTRAANLLGIKLTTLHDKIKRYNIDTRNMRRAGPETSRSVTASA
jgi:DNA-binding NtrC family response regulator